MHNSNQFKLTEREIVFFKVCNGTFWGSVPSMVGSSNMMCEYLVFIYYFAFQLYVNCMGSKPRLAASTWWLLAVPDQYSTSVVVSTKAPPTSPGVEFVGNLGCLVYVGDS